MRYLCLGNALAVAALTVSAMIFATGGVASESGGASPVYLAPEDSPGFAKPQFISRPLTFAYPGLEYNIRPAIKGGTFPYSFRLTKSPKGMTIDRVKGTVIWLAPKTKKDGKKVTVTIEVKDFAGRVATQAFHITVTKKQFFFVAPDGDDNNPGTLKKPWKTILRSAMPPDGFVYPPKAILYARGGEYKINRPSAKDKLKGNGIPINKNSPRYWIAYPGEKPVINFGWSKEKQLAAYAAQKASGTGTGRKGAPSVHHGYGHRFGINHPGYLYFDGFEIKNTCYYTFVMWNGGSTVHFRRTWMHHLYVDEYANPSFIFTFAANRKGGKKWGVRAKIANPYKNFVIQDCHFSDRFYLPKGEHGAAITFFTVHDSVVEDNLFERIHKGYCMQDKDNGFGNTYRGNIIRGSLWFRTQGSNAQTEVSYNFIEGALGIGNEAGWVKNIWVHHNTIRGTLSLIYGSSRVPDELKEDITTPEHAAKAIKSIPDTKRLVHFYRNVIDAHNPDQRRPKQIMATSHLQYFTEKWRYVRWNENLIDSDGKMLVANPKRTTSPIASFMKKVGIGSRDVYAKVKLNAAGKLIGATKKYNSTYGRFSKPITNKK